jgi:hypothetical protein
MPKTIRVPVGFGASGSPQDVMTVQYLLNCVPAGQGGPSPELAVDGVAGPKTIAEIRGFQKTLMPFPDGRVDPGGPTLARLQRFDPYPNQPMPAISAFPTGPAGSKQGYGPGGKKAGYGPPDYSGKAGGLPGDKQGFGNAAKQQMMDSFGKNSGMGQKQGFGLPGDKQGFGNAAKQQMMDSLGKNSGIGQKQGFGWPGNKQGFGNAAKQQMMDSPGKNSGIGQKQGFGLPGKSTGAKWPGGNKTGW